MALQLSKTTQHGITLATAYAKVSTFSGNKDALTCQVDYFATQAARDAGTPIVLSEYYQWNRTEMAWTGVTDTDALVSKIYTWLKTQPQFNGALDV